MKLALLAALGFAAYQYDKKQVSEGKASMFSGLNQLLGTSAKEDPATSTNNKAPTRPM